MTDHDSLCPESEPDPGDTVRQHGCLCYLIAKVRADERERIAQAIEAVPPLREPTAQILQKERRLALTLAARIARGDDR